MSKKRDQYDELELALRNEVRKQQAPTKQPTKKQTFHKHQITLLYSVRHYWGGPRFSVEYTFDTFNMFEAEMQAKSKMNRERYIDIVALSTKKS